MALSRRRVPLFISSFVWRQWKDPGPPQKSWSNRVAVPNHLRHRSDIKCTHRGNDALQVPLFFFFFFSFPDLTIISSSLAMGEFSPRSVSFVGVRKKDLLTSPKFRCFPKIIVNNVDDDALLGVDELVLEPSPIKQLLKSPAAAHETWMLIKLLITSTLSAEGVFFF